MDPKTFRRTFEPYAIQVYNQYHLPVSILLSQSALETGWATKVVADYYSGVSSNNYFNIKALRGYSGRVAWHQTGEFINNSWTHPFQPFRMYNNALESFLDYGEFIVNQSNHRYDSAVAVAHDPVQYIQAIAASGYATDPQYANKIMRIAAMYFIP
jgi:flagellar protein FlgJ